ncbi:MAG: Rpn family recombination-promoting nuclease/putative transposase [Defluviitaleaceae bacterium]|nr:Rpn family recombination-promoting nuclease/putative transposase [Defluviitaleaceae bacterium]
MSDVTAAIQHKNNAFITLFSDPARLIKLYNALTGSDLPLTTPIDIVTLENVLYNILRNDIAFVIDGKLVILIEHQSTINNNMPLRILVYMARILEKLIENESIYREKLLKIPRPDFVVLYNGEAPFPDEKTLRLSDAFMFAPEGIAAKLGGMLELTVRVVNVNEGRNAEILQRCKDLSDYAHLISKIREYKSKGLNLTQALTQAVGDCINNGILEDFLKSHSSEVLNMFTQEFDINVAKKIWMEEAREDAVEEIQIEHAKAMLQNNLPVDLIMKITKLSQGQIEALA